MKRVLSGPVASRNLVLSKFGGSPSANGMMYSESVEMVRVEIPADLARAAGLNPDEASVEAAKLLAVELYREDKVSLGRAAELCHMPIEQFMKFTAQYQAPVHYGASELEEDRRTLKRLGL